MNRKKVHSLDGQLFGSEIKHGSDIIHSEFYELRGKPIDCIN